MSHGHAVSFESVVLDAIRASASGELERAFRAALKPKISNRQSARAQTARAIPEREMPEREMPEPEPGIAPPASIPLRARRKAGRTDGKLARFVALLLDDRDDRCRRIVSEAALESRDPQRVADTLLGPAARLVGDCWRRDACDFVQVTVAMTRLQRLFWHLVEMFPPQGHACGRRILLSPAPGEEHSFGLGIVEDMFRRGGWQVDFCGVGEQQALAERARRNHYDLIGLSVSGNVCARGLPSAIRRLKERSRNGGVKVMIGGCILVDKPELALDAGADLLAMDPAAALELADRAVAGAVMDTGTLAAAE